jgi:uncharacterized protein
MRRVQMQTLITRTPDVATRPQWTPDMFQSLTVRPLAQENKAEVLTFLAQRPAHTFGMVGFIETNGLVSEFNRGTFYGCRNEAAELEGVALIGHYILIEVRSDAALEMFARLAQECTSSHMVLGEQEIIETFWSYYADGGLAQRLHCRELLLEQRTANETEAQTQNLRLATAGDLELIVPAHAQSAFEESGTDPLQTDPDGFRERCSRRIDLGQTWVWVRDGRLIFKAEIITDTSSSVYLEGVWVDPSERGKGVGTACIAELTDNLLKRTSSVCLLVNEKSEAAQACYRKAGFSHVGHYDTIFLTQRVQ